MSDAVPVEVILGAARSVNVYRTVLSGECPLLCVMFKLS